MWTYDGAWHRLAADDLSIAVLESSPPTFDRVTDVEVTCSGARWSATFMTPEQIRECLTRWTATGEAEPGNEFYVHDGVIVADMNLEVIETVVQAHLATDGSLRPPLRSAARRSVATAHAADMDGMA